MPLVGTCHKVNTVPHFGTEKYHLGLAVGGVSKLESLKYRFEIVSVGLDDIPAECRPLVAKVTYSAHGLNGAVDLLAVPVGKGNKVIKLVMGSPHSGLPNLSFLALTVAKQAVNPLGSAVKFLAQCHTGSAGKALAKGAGALENTGKTVGNARMSLQAGAELTECSKLAYREVTCPCQYRIIYRGKVPGGDDECVLPLGAASPGGGIVLHFVEIECGHHVRDAERAARVA